MAVGAGRPSGRRVASRPVADVLGAPPETPSANARISFARIEAISLAEPFPSAIQKSLKPGTQYERYTRLWRLGQWQENEGLIWGRLGFEAPAMTEVWSEDIVDFEEHAYQGGTTAPFVIDPEDQRVAFQVRPGVIRPTTFTGALQALLNAASDYERWRVYPDTHEVDWPTWLRSVDRLVQLRIRVERPNPHYSDRERVEALIEGTNARMADLVLTAEEEGDGIDINDAFVAEALAHAEKYGKWGAEGERAGQTTRWRSDETASTAERTIEADPETQEARFEGMVRELREGEPPEGVDE